jgi:hypothetical protein
MKIFLILWSCLVFGLSVEASNPPDGNLPVKKNSTESPLPAKNYSAKNSSIRSSQKHRSKNSQKNSLSRRDESKKFTSKKFASKKKVSKRVERKTVEQSLAQNQISPANCSLLETQYKQTLSPLPEVVDDSPTQQCVFKQKISEENLNFFLRAAFYHKDEGVKKEAFNKLDSFACGLKISCQEFYKIIETHNRAAFETQKNNWQGYSARANNLKEKALAKINRL